MAGFLQRKTGAVTGTQGKHKTTDAPQITRTTRISGQDAENLALQYLRKAGLQLLQRNYRMPGRGGTEIDLIMREPNGTVVFVEVRQRNTAQYGGAAASVHTLKQRRIARAAHYYLLRYNELPPCRFDVLAIESPHPSDTAQMQWIKAAFDVGSFAG